MTKKIIVVGVVIYTVLCVWGWTILKVGPMAEGRMIDSSK